MAQLHRRVFRLPNRRILGLGLAAGLLLGSPAREAAAEEALPFSSETVTRLFTLESAFGLADLTRWTAALGSEDAEVRRHAVHRLSTLDEEALPAITERIGTLEPLSSDLAREVLTDFRHATGSRRADDRVDLLEGLLPMLARDRGKATLAMAERLVLLRSLERIGTYDAGRRLGELLAIDYEAWGFEPRRIQERMGARLLPSLIGLRGHPNREVRAFSRTGLEALAITDTSTAVHAAESAGVYVLADLVRAFGRTRDMEAMPLAASYLAHPAASVRDAAREAMERYGKNGIWQLRRVYHIHAGREAPASWGWERALDELLITLESNRRAAAESKLADGLDALARGDLESVEQAVVAAMADVRSLERKELAEALVKRADDASRRGDLDAAVLGYERAMRLVPPEKQPRAWHADLAWLRAELDASRGVLDVEAYRNVLRIDGEHARALAALDRLTGERAARERTSRRWASAIAALLLSIVGFTLGRRAFGRSGHLAPPDDSVPTGDTPTEPGLST